MSASPSSSSARRGAHKHAAGSPPLPHFCKRAVSLTQEPARHAGRALAAAQASLQAGAFDVALRLTAAAEAGPLDDFERARAELLRAQVTFMSNRDGDAPALLLQAAKQLEPLDVALARETYLEALMAAQFAGRFAPGSATEIAQTACTAPPAPCPRAPDLLLDGLKVMITEGHAAAAPLLERAVDTFLSGDGNATREFRWFWLAEAIAIEIWDHESWRDLAVRELELVRDAGALTLLPLALSANVVARIFAGDLAGASSLIDQVQIATEATGSHLAPYGALILAAWRGSKVELAALSELTLRDVATRREGLGVSTAHWASALLHNGIGQYPTALAAAQNVLEPASPKRLDATIGWALPELVEAAVRSDQASLAHNALEQLSAMTRAAGTDWAIGIEARCRALVSEPEVAEHFYTQASDHLARTRLRPELARAHLLYGEWLRRENRRVDARIELRLAHELFMTIGMEAFAERARGELQAAGERVRKRTAEARDGLTAQERQIAELARDGLSNPEIGARLFLSPRTVEWHLRKVFAKLGIRSRQQLADALPLLQGRPQQLEGVSKRLGGNSLSAGNVTRST